MSGWVAVSNAPEKNIYSFKLKDYSDAEISTELNGINAV